VLLLRLTSQWSTNDDGSIDFSSVDPENLHRHDLYDRLLYADH
jgi:hypothetical protein